MAQLWSLLVAALVIVAYSEYNLPVYFARGHATCKLTSLANMESMSVYVATSLQLAGCGWRTARPEHKGFRGLHIVQDLALIDYMHVVVQYFVDKC